MAKSMKDEVTELKTTIEHQNAMIKSLQIELQECLSAKINLRAIMELNNVNTRR